MLELKNIKKGITSTEHDKVVLFASKIFKLKPVRIIGNKSIKGMYFPDAVNNTTDYEVEVVPRKNYLKKKAEKWDKSRKRVLILKPNSFAFENFDEVLVVSDKKLIRIKPFCGECI